MSNIDNDWKPAFGAEDFYEVSTDGAVRRTKNACGTKAGRLCKPSYNQGYTRYWLSIGGKRPIFRQTHRLVWETFVGPIPPNLVINHKNGIKDDNRLENLEVVSISQNTVHGFRVLGRKPCINPSAGEQNGRSKITWDMVREIRRLYATGECSQQALASAYGIDQTSVSRIVLNKSWQE